MAEFPLTNTAQQVDDAIQAVVDAPNNSVTSGSNELVTAGTIHTHVASQVSGFATEEVTTAPTGQTMATSGTTTLGGGLIMKFGTIESTSNSQQTFTYPAAFPNNAFVVVLSNLTNGGRAFSIHPETFNTTGFTVDKTDDFPSGTYKVNFIAIGN